MNIVIVIDETPYYHPKFMEELVSVLGADLKGVALVTKIPKKHSLAKFLKQQFYSFKFSELLKILKKNLIIFKDFLFKKEGRTYYKVESILKEKRIPYLKIENDINQTHYLDWIAKHDPDVIFSSCTLYFKKDILELPRICCLNRHSAYLPSYKGVWALFHSYRNQEEKIGTTIHKMNLKIDGGEIISQKVYPLDKDKSIDELYKQSYEYAVSLFLDALVNLEDPSFTPIQGSDCPSYYSFPTKEHIQEFRALKGKFI